jgi:hypothetical protein
MKDALRQSIQRILQNEVPALAEGAMPVERLAFVLTHLPARPGDLAECAALLGDGLTGALLYETFPELTLSRLAAALESLSPADTFTLITATLWVRPLRQQDVGRYATMCFDAWGIRPGDDTLPARWSTEEKLVLYRWSTVLSQLHESEIVREVAGVVEAAGIPSVEANHVMSFRNWLGLRMAMVLTPAVSENVMHAFKEAGRADWDEMPWTIGTQESTVSTPEEEDDSSPENMNDGERGYEWLSSQRLPFPDFQANQYGWNPRQKVEDIRRMAVEDGIAILEPAARDQHPRAVPPREMTLATRKLQAKTLLELKALGRGELPVDLRMTCVQDETQHTGLDFNVSRTFKTDGDKVLVRLFFHDPAPVVKALREAAAWLTPEGLPRVLARLHPHCSRMQVVCAPKSMFASPANRAALFFDVDSAVVRWWDPTATHAVARATAAEAPHDLASLPAGEWHGHYGEGSEEQLYPLRFHLVGEGSASTVVMPGENVIEVDASLEGDRIALRQRDAMFPLMFEGEFNAEDGSLKGQWRSSYSGGTFSVARIDTGEEPELSAEELAKRALGGWASRVKVPLEALRFPGEVEHLRALFEVDEFRAEYLTSVKARRMRTQAKHLDAALGRGITQLTPAMLPGPFRALEAVVARLGFEGTVRLWLHADADINAFVTEDQGEVTVHFTSGLLEVFDDVELQAVIGHELGHVLFGHHDLAMHLQNSAMSEQAKMRYFALRRYQELSTDRLGMLACGDPRAQLMAQTIMRTGIRKRELFGTADGILANARQEVEALRRRAHLSRGVDTHPYASVRTVAAELFSRSALFSGAGGASTDDAAFRELAQLLDMPTGSDARPHDGADGEGPFMVLAALRLAEADGGISAHEIKSLIELGPGVEAILDEVLGWSYERREVEIVANAARVRMVKPVPKREELLMKLLDVVRADKTTEYDETSQFNELGCLLGVDTPSFAKTLRELNKASR